MSTTHKVELVASVCDDYGLKPALTAVELPKSTWYYHRRQKVAYEQKYAHLRPVLEEIARQHPDYGYRRTTAELNDRVEQIVNHKVVRRLHQMWELRLLRTTQPPQPSPVREVITAAGDRVNLVARLDTIGLFEVAYTDFTELRYAAGRHKAYLMPIIGHACKLVYGWAVGPQANTELALAAWAKARHTFRRLEIDYPGMIIHHDQDPVYTGYEWTGQLLLQDQVRLSYALNGARDNPTMESFNGRFKTENEDLFLEAQTLSELRQVVAERISYYNQQRRHSSLGYLAPLVYLEQHIRNGTDRHRAGA